MEVFREGVVVMFKKIKKRIAAYKKISAEIKLQEVRQAQYEALVGESCSYPIIRDLINSAQNDVVISFIFRDGTKMEIRREEKSLENSNIINSLF